MACVQRDVDTDEDGPSLKRPQAAGLPCRTARRLTLRADNDDQGRPHPRRRPELITLVWKPGSVGEFDRCQGNVRELTKYEGRVKEMLGEILPRKTVYCLFQVWGY